MSQQFLWGATAFASAVAALFFLRFWRDTRERLFAFFAGAFALLGLNWLLLDVLAPERESEHLVYLVRLAAFLVLLVGIIDRNRRP
jgi:hypothetical protein